MRIYLKIGFCLAMLIGCAPQTDNIPADKTRVEAAHTSLPHLKKNMAQLRI